MVDKYGFLFIMMASRGSSPIHQLADIWTRESDTQGKREDHMDGIITIITTTHTSFGSQYKKRRRGM